MGTHVQILDGIQARLATIPGLRTGNVSLAEITPPCAFPSIPTIPDYHDTSRRGKYNLSIVVYVFVSAGMPNDKAQLTLATYSDPASSNALSIPNAIEGDRTLGGSADDCVVQSFRVLGLDEIGAIGYFGGAFNLLVINSGQ
jgi:hypothetical protein